MIEITIELTKEDKYVWALVSDDGNEKTYECTDGQLTLFFRHGIASALRLHARSIPDKVYSEILFKKELQELEDAITAQQRRLSANQSVETLT